MSYKPLPAQLAPLTRRPFHGRLFDGPLCSASFASLVHSFAIRDQDCLSSGLRAFAACRRHSSASLRNRSAPDPVIGISDHFRFESFADPGAALKVLGRQPTEAASNREDYPDSQRA